MDWRNYDRLLKLDVVLSGYLFSMPTKSNLPVNQICRNRLKHQLMQHQYRFPPTASFSHKNQTDMQKLTLVDFWQQNLYWENRPIISIGTGLPKFMTLPRQLPPTSQHSTRFGIWWSHLSKTSR